MKKNKITTQHYKMLGDMLTPVGLFLKLRDKFAGTLLLESADYHTKNNSFSYICCLPIAHFKVENNQLSFLHTDGTQELFYIVENGEVLEQIEDFVSSFEVAQEPIKGVSNGFFGYTSYDAVQYFEDIQLSDKIKFGIPDIFYQVFRFVIVFNHFHNELYIIENKPENASEAISIEEIKNLISNRNIPQYSFSLLGEETSNFSDEEFLNVLEKGKKHCFLGNVFQIVLSRRFLQGFVGDDFNVYRHLRSLNPSPYLFYFDYGSFRLMGSSPEAQLHVSTQKKAGIFPIAGTFRRTGNDEKDAELARQLLKDTKENSEHVMLVDLARNDLSRQGENVSVEVFKEVQYFSHVIHLVSKVTASLAPSSSTLKIAAATFPAGTLSGAPKYKAMQVIDENENVSRGFYGGAIGILGFEGDYNHAILIRSFLSKDNILYYQAGAGVVALSDTQSELQEVHNKLAALRTALKKAHSN